jgi:hypothetical protein
MMSAGFTAAVRAAGIGCVALVLSGAAAQAHTIAGDRVFPVTLTFDDPGVGDEFTLPQVTWQRGDGPSDDAQYQWEYDKTITPNTAIIYNHGYDVLNQSGMKARTGFENVVLTGKWQAYTNAEHEFVTSVGLAYEFPGGYATQQVGGDAHGALTPLVYFGKGLGDMPIGVLRPLAITGEAGYSFADRKLNTAGDNGGNPNIVTGSLSLQYSIPYLQSQVRDYKLPSLLGNLIPLVEADWSSPASGPAEGNPSTVTLGVGAIYLGSSYQVGLEALVPANRAAGQNVGVTVQFHAFLDDLLPHSLGRPIFQ